MSALDWEENLHNWNEILTDEERGVMQPTAPEVTRLKNCPFCNGTADIIYEYPPNPASYYCCCTQCGVHRPARQGKKYAVELWNTRTLSEPDKWAQQNPEAWEALRTGRAGVYEPAKELDHPDALNIVARLDVPFKNEAKEGV